VAGTGQSRAVAVHADNLHSPTSLKGSMSKIKFGTDGWRAIIAEEFTVDNVARVSVAVAQWVKKNFPKDIHRGGPRLPLRR
jgi:phosphomannomutase